jgi:hypothetical protein
VASFCHDDPAPFNRSKARQVFASLIRLLGDSNAAKAAPYDAFEKEAGRARTNSLMREEGSDGSSPCNLLFQLLPMVRRVPG